MRMHLLLIAAGTALGVSVALIVSFGPWQRSLPLRSADWLPPARLSEREAVRISSQVAPFWVRQSSPVTAIAQERSLNGKQPLPGFH